MCRGERKSALPRFYQGIQNSEKYIPGLIPSQQKKGVFQGEEVGQNVETFCLSTTRYTGRQLSDGIIPAVAKLFGFGDLMSLPDV